MVQDSLAKMRPNLLEAHKPMCMEVYRGVFNTTQDMIGIIYSWVNQAQTSINQY